MTRATRWVFRSTLIGWLFFIFVLAESAARGGSTLFESIDVPLDPALYGLREWRAGESAKYKITLSRPGYLEVSYLRITTLEDTSHRGDENLLWLETQIEPQNSEREMVVNRVLRPFGDLRVFLAGATGELVSQTGLNPPVSIPMSRLHPLLQAQLERPAAGWTQEKVTADRLQVPAGRFEVSCGRFQNRMKQVADVCFTPKVGPLGIVRAAARGVRIELVEHQPRGAQSAIVYAPVQLPQP
ncbi:MAG: hypothetical protein AB1898_08750 [Acidobacteriota bacterium]